MAKKGKDCEKPFSKVLYWKKIKWPVISAGGVLLLFFISFAVYSISYAKTIYHNVYVGDTNLGGKKKTEIAGILKPKSEEFLKTDIVLKYKPTEGESKEYVLKSTDFGLVYDLDKTSDQVYAVGRQGGALRSFYQQLKTLFAPYYVDASFTINEEALSKKISEIAIGIDVPEKDFALNYVGNGQFELLTERQEGKRIDQEDIIARVRKQVSRIKVKEISFESARFVPRITEENAKKTLADANKILAAGDLNLSFSEKVFNLDVDTIAGLIGSRPKKKELEIYILSDRAGKQIDGIAAGIDRAAGDAILAVKDGKVIVSSDSQDGRQLDKDQTKIDIENSIMSRVSPESTKIDPKKIVLKVNLIKPEIDSKKLSEYGLTELVATGTTNFAKSPSNRIHNINVGATAINGTLIKPGEEFSTLGKLGKINASTGYLPELVIKNNKTVPDYGGGLCQVSTTLFRAALNAGMKITSRQNHSYRVSYYEPPIGMDATIFDPAPDFKFVNNYSSYIFVQSRIVGTKITFEFYGTKDSRVIEIGQAVGYDYVEPPVPVETVDNSLPVGARELVSHSHQGASAKFHYKISKDGQILQETDFLSKYVALPEQWRVGPPAPVDPNAGTTPVPDPATPPA